MSNVRISLTLEQFRTLVSGGVVSHGKKYGNRGIFPIEICLQDIGFGPMFCAVADAASPNSVSLACISKMLAEEFDKLERKAIESEDGDAETDGGADRTPPR